jgi:glycerate 2-kinase
MKIPHSIAGSMWQDVIVDIMKSTLEAVDPREAVKRHVKFDETGLSFDEHRISISHIERISVLGAGKASWSIAVQLYEILGVNLSDGAVIGKCGELDSSIQLGPVKSYEGGHPVPDIAGLEGARHILQEASGLGERDLLIAAISGGASALMTLPADGLSLLDLQLTTEILLGSGAPICDLNAVRKHLSGISGGLLGRAAYPARTVALLLSDVVGDHLDVIGSGPTAPDPTTFANANEVLGRYDLMTKVPEAVRRHLARGEKGGNDDTPKPGDPIFERVDNLIIGSNRLAAEAAIATARKNGFDARIVDAGLEGEARDIGVSAVKGILDNIYVNGDLERPACLVLGGETTVTLKGDGKGGRNQELALSAAITLDELGLNNTLIVALATDGGDGPTDAAGAVATGTTVSRGRELGLDAGKYLDNNDAYNYFAPINDLIITGPTGTNVADLLFIFVF